MLVFVGVFICLSVIFLCRPCSLNQISVHETSAWSPLTTRCVGFVAVRVLCVTMYTIALRIISQNMLRHTNLY